jgi:prepilin-type N-terminal cleavage/methylation domain-containing protein
MNYESKTCRIKTGWGFTLIELLVVIAVMAILAALIFPVTGAVNRQKIRSKASAELKEVESAIQLYKEKLGHYPQQGTPNPNTGGYAVTPLYYELAGTRLLQNGNYETLDGASIIQRDALQPTFGVGAFVNSMRGQGDDESRKAQRFNTSMKPHQAALMNANDEQSPRLMVCTVGWKNLANPVLPNNPSANPFFYNAFNPTNNPNSFDLWVDVIVDGKTNRINNWTREPIIP